MRIDAHQHFWRHDAARDTWITEDMSEIRRDFMPGDLEPELAAHAIDGCVAVQADQSENETRLLLDLAKAHRFIKGVVGWVDLVAPGLDAQLEELSTDDRLAGVRHVAQAEPDDFLTRDDVVRGIGRLAAFGLTYDILVYSNQLAAALSLVQRLPNQSFVLDHLGKPRIRDGVLEPWATQVKKLARHPNVYCKLSGVVTEADWRHWRDADLRPYLEVAFEAFGPERVMFGSDWPVCLLAGNYGRVLGVVERFAEVLSESERAALFGGNASRFYGLRE